MKNSLKMNKIEKDFIEVKEKNIEDILNKFKEHIKFFSSELLRGKSIDSIKVEKCNIIFS